MRLGRGEIQRRTSEHLRGIIPKLANDPTLDKCRTVIRLMNTEGSILQRYNTFFDYPTKLWEMCKEFNKNYYAAIEDLLETSQDRLDCGYSLQLQANAFAANNDQRGVSGEALGFY